MFPFWGTVDLRLIKKLIPLLGWMVLLSAIGLADEAPSSAGKLLPDKLGDYSSIGAVRPARDIQDRGFNETGEATREYRASGGQRFSVTVVSTISDSSAYALLTNHVKGYADEGNSHPGAKRVPELVDVGTAGYLFSDSLFFYKGRNYVVVGATEERARRRELLNALAINLAELLDKGDGELPPLARHLPDWPNSALTALYAVNPATLNQAVSNQDVVSSIDFLGGAEAVTSNYDVGQLLIVEFTTPQLATANDQRITNKIRELWSRGRPAPTAYRRVGNYSVFVFNAADAGSANKLIDQVKYEQVVRWLGDNPNILKEAQRRYTETTLAVFISVLKASGVAAVLCFGVGGLFGALLFAKRRAEQAEQQAYSDAGGMMRLNLDEMTPETEPGRLLGTGAEK